MNEALREELLAMVEEEQRLHTELTRTGEIYREYAPALEALNLRQARRLAEIMDRYGWPGKTLVGKEAAHAAWFTAQHAISLPSVQRKALHLLRKAVEAGEAEPAQAAYLEDKIAFMERRPQRYGTQFDWDEAGLMRPWMLAEPDRVDQLRAGIGLGPLAARIADFADAEGRPADLAEYHRRFEEWRRHVGWAAGASQSGP